VAAGDGGEPGASTRARLLDAAAAVFAQYGAGGATTRRIAARAGVNEVTLFRLFGTKEALLDAAVHACAAREPVAPLPTEPVDPERELTFWCAGELARLRRSAELLRQCFAESDAEHAREAGAAVAGTADVLRDYVARLAGSARSPLVGDAADRDVAVTMLVSTIVADALARDEMPGVHSAPTEDAPARYARTFLRALGWVDGESAAPAPGAARWEWAPPGDAA
jgi:AcrR family transcriptional regulator